MGPRTPRRQRQPTNGQSHPPLGGSQTAQASGSNLASPPRVQTAEPQPNSHLTNGAQNTQDPHREIQITDLDQLLRRPDPPDGPRSRSRPNHPPQGGSQPPQAVKASGSRPLVVNWNPGGKYLTVHPSGPRLRRPHEGSQMVASQSHESDSTSPHEHLQNPESHASDSDSLPTHEHPQAQLQSHELDESTHSHDHPQVHAGSPPPPYSEFDPASH
ncbi:hypothetical protein H0H92_003847 [Tricholoma furcatifolium]|nr:hypothetical protein H0H92_003847 [Tricholoma furcatifolium]